MMIWKLWQERHTSRIAEIRASINEIETGFEYDKVERAEDTTRELTRAEEDYKHNREGMLAELAAAETEAEKARIQDRIDELDYEFNTKRQRKLEDQAEEDSDAEYAKNVRVKALQAQLAAEETEYDKQKKKRLADQTELENAARACNQVELDAIQERYDTEVASANKALTEIAAKRDEALAGIKAAPAELGPAAKAFEDLGVKIFDLNGNLRILSVVWQEVIDKLGKIPNETERDVLAMELLGQGRHGAESADQSGSGRAGPAAPGSARYGGGGR